MYRGLCLNGRDARLQTGDHIQIDGRGKDPDIRRPVDLESVEPGRRNADDRVAPAANCQRASEDVLATTESGTPPACADHRDVAVRRDRRSADDRRHAEPGEEVRRDLFDVTHGLHGAVNGNLRAILQPHEADDVGEDLGLGTDGIEHGPIEGRRQRFSEPGVPDLAVLGEDLQHHQTIRVANRQRAKQQVVDQAEERGVGADAERERERDDAGEHRTLPDHPDAVPRVLRESHRRAASLARRDAVREARPARRV